MNVMLVELLLASQTTTPPDVPVSPNLTTYGLSLVRVNWTNANGGTKQTRVYRKIHGGPWSLADTVSAGVATYDTGDSAASNYTYGVAHFDSVTGLESSIVTAEDLPPSPPTNVVGYTYAGTKKGITWTNAESMAIRCYRSGALISTKIAGTEDWASGFTSGTLGVSHYNSSTGQESSITYDEGGV